MGACMGKNDQYSEIKPAASDSSALIDNKQQANNKPNYSSNSDDSSFGQKGKFGKLISICLDEKDKKFNWDKFWHEEDQKYH